MTRKRIIAADLFCGAGGTSTGLSRAAERLGRRVELTAVNHWERAVETHAANHPAAFHFCQDLADLDPRKAVPGGRLDLLVASPECTHHSVARGGKPVNDQSRATAYCVHRWCAALDVRRVLIENVPEFTTWGPLDAKGRPTKRGRGKLFEAFLQTFRAMGYRVEWRILNAADFGAATTRRRLFIQCVKGRGPIRWPDRTHEPNPTPGLTEPLPKWRAARGIIDWSMRGTSIFGRKRPLSANTLKRIAAGLAKFGGAAAEPFLVMLRRHADGRSVELPVPTLTAGGTHVGLCEPFLVPFYANGGADGLGDPLRTVTTKDRHALVEPDRARLDILFRMLQPHELAAAMGFPAGYKITGNRTEQVKQIGNAVEVNQATALSLAMLEDAA